ncbi:putative KAP-like P-loop ATPase [Lysobacter enzymogenes]|uniref:KAP family P-loop NTPase fold protein n=1 Tax=Lysobacter enzymogenes TaxID=69 RepID=UPI003392DA42
MKLWPLFRRRADGVKPAAENTSMPDESTYSTDRPIRSASGDRFARAPFSRHIAETIVARRDQSSLVLGLYAPWGDGKTSVLHMIEERLASEANVVLVRFNPWHFTSEEQLIKGFFGTLAAAIQRNLATTGEKIGDAMKKYGVVLSFASAPAGQAAKSIGEALATTSLETLKTRIERGLSESGKKVVVLIDDIDRLDRAETHAIFKLVKLTAGFDYTTYLLAFDDAVVSAALGERYGEGGHTAGRAFLEKIIQVPLHLPPASTEALRRLTFEGVEMALKNAEVVLSPDDADRFSMQFMGGLEPRLKTPRQARLYANALMFSIPLVQGEVDIVDFMLVEGLRAFHPRVHAAIRENPERWIGEQQPRGRGQENWLEVAVDELAPGLLGSDRAALGILLTHLFPRVANMAYGSEWEKAWGRNRRVCSRFYFQRYFAYGVPPNDVSDRAIDTIISSAPGAEQKAIAESLLALVQAAPSACIRKFRQQADSITSSQAMALLPVLPCLGDVIPQERGPFIAAGTQGQLAILIANLLGKVESDPDRMRLAESIVETATPLTFAAEIVRWWHPKSEQEASPRLIPDDELQGLKAHLVVRAAQSDEAKPLYRQFGNEARVLYWMWYRVDPEGLSARLRQNFRRADDDVDAFLNCMTGEAWELDSGLPRKSDFRRNEYDEVARLIEPSEVANELRRRYGAELDEPKFDQDDGVPVARRIAHQFMSVHQAVLAEDSRID